MIRNHQNIFIVGLPGSGKTTFGKLLAKELCWNFEDSDQVIETEEGATIKKLFDTHGEKYFRQAEYNYLKNFSGDRVVVATGGGMPCFPKNLHLLQKKGMLIYLKCPVSLLLERLSTEEIRKRPLMVSNNPEELSDIYDQLLKTREPYYLKADLIIDCQQKTEIFVKIIKQMLF
ncbi:MAG: shikimate kinase [Saprospiraceae bacterium]|nr:shikimate kinase [Saprospiraceae bacterium]